VNAADVTLGPLRERLRAAHAQHRPVRLRGAGSKDFYGERLEGEVLELAAHRGIVAYEPSELVVTARCGTRLSELEETLAAHGQFLAFEPPRFGADPTVGGLIAAGLSGPRRPYAGAARDFVLGTRLLTAAGEELRFGGEVMKNVAGFDVSRLLCGSLGILGVITEVSLKVLPLPRAEETLRLDLKAEDAVQAFNRWAGQPLPLSGAAWRQGAAWVRLSGAEPAVRAARERLGGEAVAAEAARTFWQELRDGAGASLAGATLWRVSVPPAAPPLPIPTAPLIDWGGALRWYAGVPEGVDVRALALTAGGTAACWRGAEPGGFFPPLPEAVARLHLRLKERFDPQRLINRGRLIADL